MQTFKRLLLSYRSATAKPLVSKFGGNDEKKDSSKWLNFGFACWNKMAAWGFWLANLKRSSINNNNLHFVWLIIVIKWYHHMISNFPGYWFSGSLKFVVITHAKIYGIGLSEASCSKDTFDFQKQFIWLIFMYI